VAAGHRPHPAGASSLSVWLLNVGLPPLRPSSEPPSCRCPACNRSPRQCSDCHWLQISPKWSSDSDANPAPSTYLRQLPRLRLAFGTAVGGSNPPSAPAFEFCEGQGRPFCRKPEHFAKEFATFAKPIRKFAQACGLGRRAVCSICGHEKPKTNKHQNLDADREFRGAVRFTRGVQTAEARRYERAG
jgi:hypothetical protein